MYITETIITKKYVNIHRMIAVLSNKFIGKKILEEKISYMAILMEILRVYRHELFRTNIGFHVIMWADKSFKKVKFNNGSEIQADVIYKRIKYLEKNNKLELK